MAKMVHMVRTAADKKAEKKKYNTMPGGDSEDYPYGLSVSLNHDSLTKLGMTGPLPKVGSKIPLTAHAHVKSTSEENRNGRKERRMELELRHMSLEHRQTATANDNDGDEGMGKGMKGAMDKALETGSENPRKKAKA